MLWFKKKKKCKEAFIYVEDNGSDISDVFTDLRHIETIATMNAVNYELYIFDSKHKRVCYRLKNSACNLECFFDNCLTEIECMIALNSFSSAVRVERK